MQSRLLDMRDCALPEFGAVARRMLRIQLEEQPAWFRPLLLKSARLRKWIGYDHPGRRWEYPWAVLAADPWGTRLRTLDVGGGGSPFAQYLAELGHESYVADPDLNEGMAPFDLRKGLLRSARSVGFRLMLKATGVRRVWGLPGKTDRYGVRYYSYPASALGFADRSFERVFCLSVMEHVPTEEWARCMQEFQRVLKPGGRLIVTLDMGPAKADARQYTKLIDTCALRLLGDPHYATPVPAAEAEARHPGRRYETMGLVWEA